MTDETKALLPVTQADRDAAADFMDQCSPYLGDCGMKNSVQLALIQAFARHRQSHFLPGDVGLRETVARVIHKCLRPYPLTEADWDGPAMLGANNGWRRVAYAAADAILAALTPSPCPGDVGMREAATALLAACEQRANSEGGDFGPLIGPAAYAVEQALAAALTPSALSGDAGEGVKTAIEFIDKFFEPWGSWKTVWWEGEVSDHAAFSADNALKHVANLLRAALPSQQGAE